MPIGDFVRIASISEELARRVNQTPGTAAAGKFLCLDDNGKISGLDLTSPKVAGTAAWVLWALHAYGTWGIDVDAALTNGGGIVGPVTTTELAAGYCKVYDLGTTAYRNIEAATALTHYTGGAYQALPDAASEAVGDAMFVGSSTPFCEVAFDIGTAAVWFADGSVWEYWNGTAWTTLTIVGDRTDSTAGNGLRSLQQDGALSFVPPSDWTASTIDTVSAYWIRLKVSAAQLTTTPVLNSKRPYIVTPTYGFLAPHQGTISALRAASGEASMGSTADTKFILHNFTTGAHSGELTWTKAKRHFTFSSLSLAVTAGDNLGVLVTAEDGTTERANAVLELTVTPS